MKTSHKAVFALAGTTLLASGCAHSTSHPDGPQFQAIPIKGVSGETIVFQDEVIVHKDVVSTEVATETPIPARTIPAVEETTYKTVTKTNSCGKPYTAKVPAGKKVVTPAQVIPATTAVEKTTTTVTTTSEEPIKGGAAIGGLRYANGSATDPNLINVATQVDSEGNIRKMAFTPVATESDLRQVGGFIHDTGVGLGTLLMGGAAVKIAADYEPEDTNVTANGGNSESNANAQGGQGGQGGKAYAEGGDAYAEGGKAFSNSDSKSFSNADAKSNSFSNANAENNNVNLNKNYNQNTNNNLNLNKNNNMNLNKNQVHVQNPNRPGNNGSHGGRPPYNRPSNDGCTR